MINIYVGNLPYKTSEADLAELFSKYGKVERASIVMDRQTGRSRGFGFVEMVDHAAGTKAIEELAGNEWNGRPLTINEARPRGSGTTGGGGFVSSTTSFGESAGYGNQLADSNADGNGQTPGQAGDAAPKPDETPGSQGYSNSLLNG